jgi:molybdenum cofactor cytidylyltransferase
MRPQTVDVRESMGRVLFTTIFRPGGKKLLAKGHVLREEDVKLLETEGMAEVWVTQLDEGEVGEDDAVAQVAAELGCGSIEIRPAVGGRSNLFATEPCCLLLDDDLLKQINCTSSIAIATVPNFSFAAAGARIATVKSTPFAVAAPELETVVSILRERGPLLQARPIRKPVVGVLYSDPLCADRARQLFESVMRQRLERFGLSSHVALNVCETEEAVAKGLEALLRYRPTVILMASTTAPAGPDDIIGRAISAAGCHLERFLAPVEPGNLLLLGYYNDIPIVSAPGCFRSAKANVVDLILPPLLARYRVTGWEIAGLGHGGLLG